MLEVRAAVGNHQKLQFLGMVDIPDPRLRYSQIYDYLVASKAISADGAEMGALKSLKAGKFFKEGHAGIKIQPWGASSLCVCVITNTSINEMYPLH